MAKVTHSGARATIAIWWPPVRESGRIEIYVGNCLNSGCQFLGPDYDYPDDPVRYTLTRLSEPSGQAFALRSRGGSLRVFIP